MSSVTSRRKTKNINVSSTYRNEMWYEDLWTENAEGASFKKPIPMDQVTDTDSYSQQPRKFNNSFKEARLSRSWPALQGFDLSQIDIRELEDSIKIREKDNRRGQENIKHDQE